MFFFTATFPVILALSGLNSKAIALTEDNSILQTWNDLEAGDDYALGFGNIGYLQPTRQLGKENAWPTDFQPNAWRHQEVSQLRPRPLRHLDVGSILDRKLPRELFTVAPTLLHLQANRTAQSSTDAIFLFHDISSTVYLFSLGAEDRHWASFPFHVVGGENSSLPDEAVIFRSISVTDDSRRVLLCGGGRAEKPLLATYSDVYLWSSETFAAQKVATRHDVVSSPITPGHTPSRMLHGAVYTGDGTSLPSLYVFGGGNLVDGHWTTLRDLWRLNFDTSALLSGWWEMVDSGETSGPPSGVILPVMFYYNRALIVYGGMSSGNLTGDEVLFSTGYTCNLTVFNLTGAGRWTPYPALLQDCDARSSPLNTIAVPPFAAFLTELEWLVVLVPRLSTLGELQLYVFDLKGGGDWWHIDVQGDNVLPAISYGLTQLTTPWPTISGTKEAHLLAIDTEGFKAFTLQMIGRNLKANTTAQVFPCEPNHYFFGRPNCAFTSSSSILPLSNYHDTFITLGLTCNDYHPQQYVRVGIFQVEPGATWSIPYLTQPAPIFGEKGLESPFALSHMAPLEGYSTAVLSDVAVLYGGAPKTERPTGVDNNPVDDTWCYDYASLQWYHFEGVPPPGRVYHSAIAFNQRMYVYGGYNDSQTLSELWQLTFTNISECQGEWSELTSKLNMTVALTDFARFGHSASLLGDSMYVVGGALWSTNAAEGATTHDTILKFNLTSFECTLVMRILSNRWRSDAFHGFAFHSAVAVGKVGIIAMGGVSVSTNSSCNLLPRDLSRVHPLDSQKNCTSYNRMNHFTIFYPEAHTLSEDHRQLAVDIDTGLLTDREQPNTQPLMWHQIVYDGKWIALLGGFYADEHVKSILTIMPGCPPGHFSPNFTAVPCTKCPTNSYSSKSTINKGKCTACPSYTIALTNGSTSPSSCSQCLGGNGYCHYAGTCTVPKSTGRPSCECDIGYWSFDRCRVPIIFLLIGAAGLITLLIIALLTRQYRKHKRQAEEKGRQLRSSRKELSQLVATFEIDSTEITLRRKLASGSFGEVWLAEYREMLVAVKRLHAGLVDRENIREFRKETQMMRDIRHPNVILFLGVGIEPKPSNRPFLVVEYMQRGTLEEVLSNDRINIDHIQQLRFALDVAKGMRFLHGLEKPRIHRDLKSPNLLVSERWVVKVADLGATRTMTHLMQRQEVKDSNVTFVEGWSSPTEATPFLHQLHLQAEGKLTQKVGSLLWSSPEMLADKPYGASTDVYSFGIIMWEIVCRCLPFFDLSMRDVIEVVCSGDRPMLPDNCPRAYVKLMTDCWHQDPDARPLFSEIVPRLDHQLDYAMMAMPPAQE